MRPGQSCPGVGRVGSTSARPDFSRRARFNEAGAIMPRSGQVARSAATTRIS